LRLMAVARGGVPPSAAGDEHSAMSCCFGDGLSDACITSKRGALLAGVHRRALPSQLWLFARNEGADFARVVEWPVLSVDKRPFLDLSVGR
jgi:hypothetical protein